MDRIDDYVNSVCLAIADFDFSGYEICSVYFGGGTPSLLGEKLLTILSAVYKNAKVKANAEVTFEANPCTINQQTLLTMWKGGFNRISIGVQDSNDSMLKTMGRLHNFTDAVSAIQMAKNAGFINISCDIILATPNQTVEKAVESAKQIISQDIKHISTYLLNVEKGTPFYDKEIGKACPDESETANIYLAVSEYLEKNGFEHYEISNFSKKGYESIHNTSYWLLKDYLGIGPAAYSFIDGKRFSFERDINKFISSKNVWQDVQFDECGGDFEEYLMLSLRLKSGFDTTVVKEKYGIKTDRLIKYASVLEQKGLVIIDKNKIRLTNEGFLLSNSIITEFLRYI